VIGRKIDVASELNPKFNLATTGASPSARFGAARLA